MYNSSKNLLNSDPSQASASKQSVVDYEKDVGQKFSDFKLICELGRGSYGVVNRVLCLTNNNEYVMKIINMKHIKLKNKQEALKEAQILKKLKHPNIIRYYNSFVDDDHLHIIMEYAESGDLAALIKSHREKRQYFTEKQVWDFAWELCQAIDYIHNNNIIHRDIKTLNVFLSKDGHIKLGDLGVSKIVSSAASLQGTRVGTPLYLSPELVKQLPYDFKVDIWALGCVLYHLVALEPPFSGENLISLGYSIVHKAPKALSTAYSPKLSALIMKFLEKSPSSRPKISETWDYFPSKYRTGSNTRATSPTPDPNALNTLYSNLPNGNKIELHDNIAAKLLKVNDPETKKDKIITSWASPDKRNTITSVPIRPVTTATGIRVTSQQEGNISGERGLSQSDKRTLLGPGISSAAKLTTFVSPPKEKNRYSSPIKQTPAVSSLLEGISSSVVVNDSNTLFSKRESNVRGSDQKNGLTEKKLQQDTESTVENRPRTFQAVANPIGNDSTLSAKQIKDKDDNAKRFTKKNESDVIIEESAKEKKALKEDVPRTFASQSMIAGPQAKDLKEQKPNKNSSAVISTENRVKASSDSDKKVTPGHQKEYSSHAASPYIGERPMTSDARSILMNPLIKSTSPRFKINSRFNQMPTLVGNLSKASSESMPMLLVKGDDPLKKVQQKSVLEPSMDRNMTDSKKDNKGDLSDSLEVIDDAKRKRETQSAASGVRIRPVSAHILKNMHNNLNQIVNEDKGARETKLSAFGSEKANENKASVGNQIPQLTNSRVEEKEVKAYIVNTKAIAAERPRSAVFAGRIAQRPIQPTKHQFELVGSSKPIAEATNRPMSGSRYFIVKQAGAFGSTEGEKKIGSNARPEQRTNVTKEDVMREDVDDLGIINDDDGSFNGESYNKHRSSLSRFELVGKSSAKDLLGASKKVETAEDWFIKEDNVREAQGRQEAFARPGSAFGGKKKLTIHDLK